MATSATHIFASSLLLLGCIIYSRCDLVIHPQDLTVVVGQQPSSDSQGKFKLTLSAKPPLTQKVTVKLSASYADIVQLDPDVIDFQAANASQEVEVKVFGLSPGHVEITANASPAIVNVDDAFIKVSSERSSDIVIISTTVGWIYFVVWSISFYPQMYENWKRKSVVGLNFDFLFLNLTGFTLYALFNCGLFWIPAIQNQYFDRHPHSAIPVLPNDIFFAVHAVIVTLITIVQCFIYERAGQTVSIVARCIQGLFFVILVVTLLCSVFGVLLWLDFLYICSYIKLTITLIKYIPQGYMNYCRKSTIGWSIGNILCDFTGGLLSVLQMLLDAYNFDDWASIFGSPTKFGLGLFSILFDVFFMIQHYILYRNHDNLHSSYERLDGHDSPEAQPNYSTAVDPPEEDAGNEGMSKEGASSESIT